MAAVELTDGKQVHGGHQETDPARETDRVHDDVRLIRQDAQSGLAEKTEQQGGAQREPARTGVRRGDGGEPEAEDDRGDGEHESGQGPGGGHVKEGAAIRRR